MAGDSTTSRMSLAAARAAARRVVLASPVAPQARRAAQVVSSASAQRDRRDNEALKLLVAATLAPDATAIDVGANEGRVLADVIRAAPHGHHIAYEPIPALAAELTRRYPGVDVRCAALSDVHGEASFTHVKSRPGYSGLRERPYPGKEELEQIVVNVERLDDVLPDGCVPVFIKIDVEGAEGKVLTGAVTTLERHRPVVAFEHGRSAAPIYGTTPADIHALLVARAQLRIFDMDGSGPYSLAQFEETVELGTHWNFFARI